MFRRRFLAGLIPYPLLAQQTRDLRIEPDLSSGATPRPSAASRAGIAAALSGRRTALVIGNNAYLHAPRLYKAVNDANDVGEALKRAGFSVMVLTDAPLSAMRQAVQKFAEGVKSGDVALLHYAGHGLQLGGENYAVPIDFQPESEAQAKESCERVGHIQEMTAKVGAGLTILILDACRTNPFRDHFVPAQGLALMDGGLGCYIALAAGPGQTAGENRNGRNGLFTQNLLAEMPRTGQSIDEIFHNVKRRVFDASGGSQRPWLHSDVVGDFFLFGQARSSGSGPDLTVDTPATRAAAQVAAGQSRFLAGDFVQAKDSFERAIKINPDDPFVYNALGATYARLKKWSVAVGLYARAIELKPEYATAYFNRGVAYTNAARYDLAIQDFSWAIDEDSFDPLAFDLRGRAHFAQLDYDSAMQDFARALELDPTNSDAMLGRGKVLFRQGHYPESLASLTTSIRLRPTAEAFENRALVFKAMRQPALADADSREALRLRGQ